MSTLDAPSPLDEPRFTSLEAFGNSYVQGAGSDAGTVAGGGGFVGKLAERLHIIGADLVNHAVGGSAMAVDQGTASVNCGYATVLASLGRLPLTATTSGVAGPESWLSPVVPPTTNVVLSAAPSFFPYVGRVQLPTGKWLRYVGWDNTPKFSCYDVDAAVASGSTLTLPGCKRQTKRYGQWPAGERRLVILGPTHDWLGRGSAAVPAMIAGYRTAICRALAANVLTGDGNSFNGGSGMTTTSSVQGSAGVVGSGASMFSANAVGSYMEETLPADAVGCALVAGFSQKQGQTSTWQITVNGTVHGSISPATMPAGAYSGRYTGSVYRIPAADLPKGAVVRATCTAQSGVGHGLFDYFSLESRFPSSPVIVVGTTRYPAMAAGSDAVVAEVVAAQRALVAEFARSDGRNHVRFVDADEVLDNQAANFYTDETHPSEVGHGLLSLVVEREVRAWQRAFAARG